MQNEFQKPQKVRMIFTCVYLIQNKRPFAH